MIQELVVGVSAVSLGLLLAVLGVFVVYDLKQRTRAAPDRDGFRAPDFHIFGETGKAVWLFMAVLGIVGVSIVALVVGLAL